MFHPMCVFEIIHDVFELIFTAPYFAIPFADFTFLMDEQERFGISVAVTSVTILMQQRFSTMDTDWGRSRHVEFS